ncbi:MAG: hypothetical protein U0T82_01575 [Bacteroidales bacterium]
MRPTILIFTGILAGCLQTSAQIENSFFTDAAEKRLFDQFTRGEPVEETDLLLAGEASDFREQVYRKLDELVTELKPYADKGGSKLNKTLQKKVTLVCLRSWSEKASFGDLFRNGEYNSITASALYAVLLDRIGVIYELHKNYNQVYLVVEPGEKQWMLLSSAQTSVSPSYSPGFRRCYLAYLYSLRQIPEAEYTGTTPELLFPRYFKTEKIISKRELAALHYFTTGKSYTGTQGFEQALKNYEKAWLLSPEFEYLYASKNLLFSFLSDQKKNRTYKPETLARYLEKSAGDEEARLYSFNYFEEIANYYALQNSDPTKLDAYHKGLTQCLNDTGAQREFDFRYYYKMGYFYALKNDAPNTFRYLSGACNLKKDDTQAADLFTKAALRYLIVDDNHKQRIDSLEHYFGKYSLLAENETLRHFTHYCFQQVIVDALEEGKGEEGMRYLSRFEEFYRKFEMIPDSGSQNNSELENLYIFFGVYFYRHQDYGNALAVLKRGMERFPDSKELNGRYNNLKKERPGLEAYKASQKNVPVMLEEEIVPVRRKQKPHEKIRHEESINTAVDQYLKRKWVLAKLGGEGKTVELPRNESFSFRFMEDGKVLMEDAKEKTEGSYEYNGEEGILTIRMPDDNETIRFQVVSITEHEMKALVIDMDDEPDIESMIFIAEK